MDEHHTLLGHRVSAVEATLEKIGGAVQDIAKSLAVMSAAHEDMRELKADIKALVTEKAEKSDLEKVNVKADASAAFNNMTKGGFILLGSANFAMGITLLVKFLGGAHG